MRSQNSAAARNAITPRATAIPMPDFAPVLRLLEFVLANEDAEFEGVSDGRTLVTLELLVVVAARVGPVCGVSVAVLATAAPLDRVAKFCGAGAS